MIVLQFFRVYILHDQMFMLYTIRGYIEHNPWLYWNYFEFILYIINCLCCTQFEFILNIIYDCILHNYTIRVYIVVHDPCFCFSWRLHEVNFRITIDKAIVLARVTLKRFVFFFLFFFLLTVFQSRIYMYRDKQIIMEMIRSF
jgi:hypothetical protein